jgi:putative oxygen-independent coproporphyrinogen III oxidase
MIPIYPANSISQAPLQGGTTVSGLTNPPPLSLYIHIPWCVRKCPYCDFNSHESKQEIPEVAYVDALIADLEQATPLIWGRKMHSVFFGGGTPSLFSAESIDKILSHVRMLTPLEYGAEITLEANPGTIDTAHFLGYKEAGVNRVSIGIQSFNENHLKALGRIHNREQAIQAAALAINTFDQVNLDVMYALPEQALDQALQDAQMACDLKPAHLSFYHLTLEPNTPFHRTPPSLPDDDTSAEMQEQIEALLAQHGYDNYETSAFSQAGKQCKHNLNYWTFGDYLGIGAGAHSKLSFHDKIIRQARHKHPKRYMEFTAEGKAIDQEWQIKQEDLGFEFMMNALRLSNGFDKDLIALRTGIPFITLQKQVKQAIKLGLISDELQLIKPTLKGRRFLNNLLDIFLT